MSQNEPTIPRGEYAVIVDRSTKGWLQVRHIGSLYLDGPGRKSVRVLPPDRGRSPSGYPAEISISADFDHSTRFEIKQLTGDRRTMTIWKQGRTGEAVRWSIHLSKLPDLGPFRIIMYPELEKLLEYLILHK